LKKKKDRTDAERRLDETQKQREESEKRSRQYSRNLGTFESEDYHKNKSSRINGVWESHQSKEYL